MKKFLLIITLFATMNSYAQLRTIPILIANGCNISLSFDGAVDSLRFSHRLEKKGYKLVSQMSQSRFHLRARKGAPREYSYAKFYDLARRVGPTLDWFYYGGSSVERKNWPFARRSEVKALKQFLSIMPTCEEAKRKQLEDN